MADKLKFTKAMLVANSAADQPILTSDTAKLNYIRNTKIVPDQAGVTLSLKGNGISQGVVDLGEAGEVAESKDPLLLGENESLTGAFGTAYIDWTTEVLLQAGNDAIHKCGTKRAEAHGTTFVHPTNKDDQTHWSHINYNLSYDSHTVKPIEIAGKRYIFQRNNTSQIRRIDVTTSNTSSPPMDPVVPSEAFSSVNAFCFNHDGSVAWTMHTGVVFKRWIVTNGGLTWTKDATFGDKVGDTSNTPDVSYYTIEYMQDSGGTGWLVYNRGSAAANDTNGVRRAKAADFSSEDKLSPSASYAPYTNTSITHFTRIINSDGSSEVVFQVANSSYNTYSYIVACRCTNPGDVPVPYKTMYMANTYSYSVSNGIDKQWAAGNSIWGNTLAILDHSRKVVAVPMANRGAGDARYWLLFEGIDRDQYIGSIDTGATPSSNYFLYSGFPSQDGALGASVGVIPTVEVHIESVEVSA